MNVYPFILEKLNYPYDSLEPFIDIQTMILHHDKHLKTYVDNLNEILKPFPKFHNLTLDFILKNNNIFPIELREKIKNNAGGVFNHNLYFSILSKTSSSPSPALEESIIKSFKSVENFINIFKQEALKVFGSGYTYLVVDNLGNLQIINMKNQDTPLPLNLTPILLVDVWEHAYYLKYNNRRNQYLDNFVNIINWSIVNKYYNDFLYLNK